MHWPCRTAPGFCQPLHSFSSAPRAAPSQARLVAAATSTAPIPSRGLRDTEAIEAASSTATQRQDRGDAAEAQRKQIHFHCFVLGDVWEKTSYLADDSPPGWSSTFLWQGLRQNRILFQTTVLTWINQTRHKAQRNIILCSICLWLLLQGRVLKLWSEQCLLRVPTLSISKQFSCDVFRLSIALQLWLIPYLYTVHK